MSKPKFIKSKTLHFLVCQEIYFYVLAAPKYTLFHIFITFLIWCFCFIGNLLLLPWRGSGLRQCMLVWVCVLVCVCVYFFFIFTYNIRCANLHESVPEISSFLCWIFHFKFYWKHFFLLMKKKRTNRCNKIWTTSRKSELWLKKWIMRTRKSVEWSMDIKFDCCWDR